jgi:hypothetical protein
MNTTPIATDSTKVTWSQVYNDFKGALEGAADALKVGAEHIYLILVRQQVTQSISLLIVDVVLAIAAFFAWRIVLKFIAKKREEESGLERYERGEWGFMYLIPTIATAAAVVVFIATLNVIVTGFFNPEYGALQEIRGLAK